MALASATGAGYSDKEGDTKIKAPGARLTPLPSGPIDHPWTKSLEATRDGSRLYVGAGSNSNITENGLEAEENRAAICHLSHCSNRCCRPVVQLPR